MLGQHNSIANVFLTNPAATVVALLPDEIDELHAVIEVQLPSLHFSNQIQAVNHLQ